MSKKRGLVRAGIVMFLGALAMPAVAQPAAPVHLPVRSAPPGFGSAAAAVKPSAPDYGTTALTYLQVGAAAFTPMDSSAVYTTTGDGYHDLILRTVTGSFVDFAAPIQLPGGAIVKYLELDYCDNTGGSGFVQGALVESDYLGNSLNYVGFLASDGDGCTYTSVDATSENMVVNNYLRHYWLLATISSSMSGSTGLGGMIVGYQLQVSPAPGTATFNDVQANHPFFQFIEALASSGITGGCGSGNYCPDNPVTRGQMAVFLAKALGLHYQ